jgi:hypothetical protein
VYVDQGDLDNATGNTDPGKSNGIVYLDYISCNGTPSQLQYSVADTYTNSVCVQEFSSPSPDIYYYSNNFKSAGGSSASDNFTPCT